MHPRHVPCFHRLARRGLRVALISTFILLQACGGGGGGGGQRSPGPLTPPAPPPPPPAAPTLDFTASAAKVAAGDTMTLTWSSANATGCTASGAWSGAQPATGTAAVRQDAMGRHTYTLACTGAGGTVSKSVELLAVAKMWPTSYENKHNAGIDNPRLPFLSNLANWAPEPQEMYFWSRAVAFADFFQDGTWGAIAFSTFYRDRFPGFNPNKMPDSPSKLYFLHRLPDGRWEDRTVALLREGQSRFTCLQPNYLQVADFNHDGAPDVFLTCTGVDFITDADIDGVSDQFVVLSQPDGRYVINRLDIPLIYSHGAAVADINGDGHQDILTVAPRAGIYGFGIPLVLWGRGDGTFQLDTTRFPAEMQDMPIWTIFAIPIDGQIKVVVSGSSPGEAPTHPEWRYGTKVFTYVDGRFQLELDLTPTLPKVAGTDLTYGTGLDVVYDAGHYYLWLVGLDYLTYAVAKMNATTGQTSIVKQWSADMNNWESGSMKLMPSGDVLSQMAGCGNGTDVPGGYNYWACTWGFSVR
jgi:hypothetical protein